MSDFNNQWMEIFRAGDYGDKGAFTAEDLEKLVANFDATKWEPVLVAAQIGHDEKAPALGRVAEVKREGAVLKARFRQVHPKLEEVVKDGRFPSRSVGLYLDPEGKGPMLRHVAFLGAVPPEVKGLAPVEFANFDGDGEFVAIDFNEEEDMNNETPQLSKEHVSFLTGFAEKLKSLFSSAPAAPAAGITAEQMDERINGKLAPVLAENARLVAEVKTLREGQGTAEATARRSKWTAFVERMRAAGKLVPALEAKLAPLAELAIAGKPAKVSFTEGTGNEAKPVEKEVDPLDSLMAYAEAQGQIVPLGDLGGEAHKNSNVIEMRFNETKDLKVDPASVQINARAEHFAAELRKQDPKMTELAAFKEGLRKANAEAAGGAKAAAGGATAGAV